MPPSPHIPTPPRSRSTRTTRTCLLGGLLLTAAVVLVPFQQVISDGGFPSAEYRLTFVDTAGRPVPGVTLRVETQAGGACYAYPVDEFVPDDAPTSDADGRMVFHHVSDVLEFIGHPSCNLLGMSFGDPGAPKHVCLFRLGDQEVHRVRFDDLYAEVDWERSPIVTRTWQYPDWAGREYADHQEAWSAHRERLFDVNGDGELDREERVAAGHFDRVRFEKGGREVRFYVVERTITISGP